MPRWGMALDVSRCVGCYACSVACKVENGTPEGIWYAPVYEQEVGRYPATKRQFIPMLCNHCREAPCLKACPSGAISKRADGIVLVNQEVCCGSRACLAACPYGALQYYAAADPFVTPFDRYCQTKPHNRVGTVQKCTFCVHRIDQGIQNPACVATCPTECRVFGDLDDPGSDVSQLIRRRNGTQLRREAGTDPSVWHIF